MKRALVLVLLAASALAGCAESKKDTTSQASATPSATASATPTTAGACTPSRSGSKDLTTKPVVTVPKTPAPTETTTIDIVCGTGDEAKNGSNVSVKYVGVLYQDGTEFDASWDRNPDTFEFQVGGGVVPGFSKGVTGMRVGGRREVIIPSKDGYGDQGAGPIPPGATLVFVIDLVKVG